MNFDEVMKWLESFCGEMTSEQRVRLEHFFDEGRLLGAGRALGSMSFDPLILVGEGSVNILDKCGCYQLASIDGRILLQTNN